MLPPALRRYILAAVLLICCLIATSGHASALPGGELEAKSLGNTIDDDDNTNNNNNNGDNAFLRRWDPAPGVKALAGLWERGTLELRQQGCLPNGTNFCFGDNSNFCASCGTCCVEGLYCCSEGSSCCGNGCCSSGQTCNQGQCVSSNGPVTVTSVAFQTVTHVATQVATVLIVVVETSTVVSTTETTISNAETQTNTVWITQTTTLERRGLPTAEVRLIGSADDTPFEGASLETQLSWRETLKAAWTSVTARRLPHAVHDAALERRQATRDPLTVQAQSTVTRFATSTVDVTNVISTTITTESTSLVMTTVIRTNTIVVNAKTTVDVTSTMIITRRAPVTQVITTTENPINTGGGQAPTRSAPTNTNPPTLAAAPPSSSSSSIQTPAIVGIAVGGTVAAIIVAAIAIFFIRHRRKQAALNDNPNADLPPDVNALDREPTFPTLTHFTPAATTAHHSMQFTPPPGGIVAAYLDPKTAGTSPSTSPSPRPNGHHRNSSGYSTLVGTPYGANGNNKRTSHRVSAMTTASATSGPPVPVAEVPGNQPDWQESSGRSSGSPPLGAASGSGSASRRLSQQQTPVHQSRHGSFGAQDAGPIGQAYYLGPQQQQYQQQQPPQPPGELDSNAILEMGIGNPYADEMEDNTQQQQQQGRGHRRTWSSDVRYDGFEYGDPRSPSVAPPQ
ncbi:hypothetical protein B0T16DRAFT_453110 [Cercophora newfieldiana]|uniref:Uncharacterized protein n=1 Tax=Cercophora newfieldiana TaxID=92897 RepID=A0AA39YS84_9PEZI|nr:hypothetical protein B0T16DRAFT_453110 [Cercophora newfieldiana]